ncbi:SDR family oxidoreductase [Lacticaseibacillus nasuensis]|uniref:Saccharopine dehydrogenase related protein n=1 Tax=Lacticaseibacillus nasuensis JCM 17158 TaxID=1291734 RepID=A0A0R1JIN8_9LACO|nr:SDR family oxidoreductase [Lacticaseibacillus nasuensis]KRK71134.1 saccharopine dehydrogenase related protein [Lacticaseibacillus nasuensis JCM 17158]
MTNVLILGAHGQIARLATSQLLQETDHHLRLFLRQPERLTITDQAREEVVDGDVLDSAALTKAMAGIDVVYANLGNAKIEAQAKSVVAAMTKAGVKRLIWISTLGIYDEVPGAFGQWNHQMLDGGYLETYAAAAKVIEQSGLAYTIIRPAWLSNADTVSYELTQKGEPFKGTEVSRKSIADLVVKLINDPQQHIGESLGVNQPGTDGDKPSFY